MIILSIESSCDETAAAVVDYHNNQFTVLSSIVSSQIEIHKPYGGVVPELAARNHVVNIMPVISQAIKQAGLSMKKIDRIAVTAGPGLVTSLIVGLQTAKTLAYAFDKPLVGVNHLLGHVYSPLVLNQKMDLPVISLIVSGGHTELIFLKNLNNLKKIGQTVDDAAGEAFDKVAALLNLSYPGGPIISQLAQQGDNKAYNFPRPMVDSGDFNFSFAGLKTAVLYTVKKIKRLDQKTKQNLAASFQQAVVDVLVAKTINAAKKNQAKTIALAGGVAANKLLRESLGNQARLNGLNFLTPPISFCTDNAVMIATAAVFAKPSNWQKIKADPNLEIK